ncbi:Thiamin-phosphate pyrophosphorylase [Arcticibacter svalbardensis MN12-7]|uniref:Thiamine-phosphate synthase n=1 Tax=Arcticibacter svalbardensis MN12-7 TaxID=1150600 RepID=R9GR70_9SPHI|nr:thiamine phosphate synthase [Arcticibacter svalbardensis]EOR94173.1 Thiamin-phosphate pyrophosphorylase [Arcticibacter svalbardensis MN12-7]
MKIDQLQYISQPAADGSHLTAIKIALEAGCKWIQLRIKNQSPEEIRQCAIAALKLCKFHGAKLIINDHPEIALSIGADGVHLGLEDMPVTLARKVVGKDMLIGGTANTFQQVQQRMTEGVDYIGLGPFRFTTTKEKLSPILGLHGYTGILKQMNEAQISIPVIAIGGIVADDLQEIGKTGVHGVALSGAITFSENRKQIIKQVYAIKRIDVENS